MLPQVITLSNPDVSEVPIVNISPQLNAAINLEDAHFTSYDDEREAIEYMLVHHVVCKGNQPL